MRNKNRSIGRNTEPNPKRQAAKAKRKFGLAYIKSLGITVEEWCIKKDPLYKVKGKRS